MMRPETIFTTLEKAIKLMSLDLSELSNGQVVQAVLDDGWFQLKFPQERRYAESMVSILREEVSHEAT